MILWVFWGFKRFLGLVDGFCSSDIKPEYERARWRISRKLTVYNGSVRSRRRNTADLWWEGFYEKPSVNSDHIGLTARIEVGFHTCMA